jgi:hypothetical protein
MRPVGSRALLLLLAAACSDRTTHDVPAEGSGGATGEASTTEGGSGPGADETGPAACEWEPMPIVGIDGGPGCEDLVSSGDVAPVTLRIVNDGDEVLHLTGPGSCITEYFAVEDEAGHPFPWDHCTPSCDASVLHECACLLDCPLVDTIALHPGGTFETEWPGYVGEPHEASVECAGDCAGPCMRATAPVEGQLRVLLALAGSLDCGSRCGCEPNQDGWCMAPGWPERFPTIVERSATWPPRCGTIELHLP